MVRDGICGVSVDALKNFCSHFKVVSGSLLAPIPNFIQIGQKTQKLEIFNVGRFWLVRLVGRKMVIGISNLSYIVSGSLLAPRMYGSWRQQHVTYHETVRILSPTTNCTIFFTLLNVWYDTKCT